MKTAARFSILVLLSAAILALTAPAATAAATGGSVNLNTATEKELEALPGVGPATAKKIIAGRPYASIDDLAKAGLSAKQIDKIRSLVTAAGGAPAATTDTMPSSGGGSTAKVHSKSADISGPIDLNAASAKELEALPGVGPATVKKIIAGRPYATIDDLAKAGLSAKQIDKIRTLVMVAGAASSGAVAQTQPGAASAAAGTVAAGAGLVNLNAASEKDLDSLPGVGPATVKKIIAGRPYATIDDLAKAGLSAKQIDKLRGLVTVGGAVAAGASSAGAAAAGTASGTSAVQVQAPPSAGMVWVNTETGVYHFEGDQWYGKTKQGKYMTEADAIKAGFRASKAKLKSQT
jgi:competence protein ComEA